MQISFIGEKYLGGKLGIIHKVRRYFDDLVKQHSRKIRLEKVKKSFKEVELCNFLADIT